MTDDRLERALSDAIADIVAPDDGRPVVRSLLDFLTYRAFRLSGNLSATEARNELVQLVRSAITRSTHAQERPNP